MGLGPYGEYGVHSRAVRIHMDKRQRLGAQKGREVGRVFDVSPALAGHAWSDPDLSCPLNCLGFTRPAHSALALAISPRCI